MDSSLNDYELYDKLLCNDFILPFCFVENIGNYLRSHFFVLRDWLKNNQSRAAISTSAVPPYVRAFLGEKTYLGKTCSFFRQEYSFSEGIYVTCCYVVYFLAKCCWKIKERE